MAEESYEIMPHKTIETIKKELDELKKRASSKEAISSEAFMSSLNKLTNSINGLMGLFKEAAEEMKSEEEAEEALRSKIGPLIEKVEDIEEENRAIAKSILALADMIREKEHEPEKEVIRRTWREQVVPRAAPTHKPMPLRPQHMPEPKSVYHRPPPGMYPPGPMPPRHEMSPPMEERPRLSPVPPPRPMGMSSPGPMPFPRSLPEGPMPPPGFGPEPETKGSKIKGFLDKVFKKK